jgi:hypothetical protein
MNYLPGAEDKTDGTKQRQYRHISKAIGFYSRDHGIEVLPRHRLSCLRRFIDTSLDTRLLCLNRTGKQRFVDLILKFHR